jgi:glycosyltransferase involved in cell wall biosynthesis
MKAPAKKFCEVTLWWNDHFIRNQVSPHFFYYPAELMLKNGYEVDVLTNSAGFFGSRDADRCGDDGGIRVTRLPESRLGFSTGIFKKLMNGHYSILHLHTVSIFGDTSANIASKLKGTPIVYTQHSPDLEAFETRKDFGGWATRTNWRLMDLRGCVFIAFTRWQERLYRQIGIENVRVIPHAIDPAVFDVDVDPAVAGRFGLGDKNVLCVSNIDPRKGQHILIECMPGILKEVPGTRLLLVGRAITPAQKEYKKKLEYLMEKLGIANDVVFIEDAPRELLIQLYLQSDAFAFPTDAELFGIVLLEAMAAGVPVISTDRPYLREILEDGKAGLVVAREHKPFEEGIIRLLQDKNLRRTLVAAGRKAVEEKYLLSRAIDEHWKLYRSLMGN